MSLAEYFVAKAEQCFDLAERARRKDRDDHEIPDALQLPANELTTKSVELGTDWRSALPGQAAAAVPPWPAGPTLRGPPKGASIERVNPLAQRSNST
jgi:hypothetical protein